MPANPNIERLRQAINTVIEEQLAADDPPEMRHTLACLVAKGLPEATARTLIGHVVVEEVLQVLAAGQLFDPARYRRRLQELGDRSYPEGYENAGGFF